MLARARISSVDVGAAGDQLAETAAGAAGGDA